MTNTSNVVSWCLALAAALSAQAPGRLTGRVVAEETGLPVAGRTVQAMERKASGAPTILRAVTNANGTYAIVGAPAGTYMICAPRMGVYLDPCEWGPPVLASTGTPAPDLRLQLGVQVTLRVNDPLGLGGDSRHAWIRGVGDADARAQILGVAAGQAGRRVL